MQRDRSTLFFYTAVSSANKISIYLGLTLPALISFFSFISKECDLDQGAGGSVTPDYFLSRYLKREKQRKCNKFI